MSLIYNDIQDLRIPAGGGVSYNSVRNIYGKLLSNDMQMTHSNIRPTIWQRLWYNDANIRGYNVGDAVWVNTEDVDNFVRSHESDIIYYASYDIGLKQKFNQLSADSYTSERLQLCKKIATGDGYKALYYFGDITKPIQIKISKIDNNKYEPTDGNSEYWEDFFVRYSYDDIVEQIQDICLSSIETLMAQHNKEYHLSGQFSSTEQVYDILAKNDMSNVYPVQRFNSHYWYNNTQTGFDHITYYKHIKYDNGATRWYRKWNSGKLEHGGIIIPKSPMENDTYSNGVYTVSLIWGDETPSVYDYPSDGFAKQYDIVNSIQTDNGTTSIQNVSLGVRYRYHINLTPFCTNQTPYTQTASSSSAHTSLNVGLVANDKFGIIISDESIDKISYYTSGYTSSGRS